MVLWEITLATAYFLGLRRTYRLALKIQRRLIKRHRIRQFVQRRTRDAFDIALKVHHNIQQRDIEAGRNLGNTILRWLDRLKPSAQIRARPPEKPSVGGNMTKNITNTSGQQPPGTFQQFSSRTADQALNRCVFTSSMNGWSKPFPTVAMMMRPAKPANANIQYRNLCIWGPEMLRLNYGRSGSQGVIRNDILQWMLRN